jgi:hypothetical protein
MINSTISTTILILWFKTCILLRPLLISIYGSPRYLLRILDCTVIRLSWKNIRMKKKMIKFKITLIIIVICNLVLIILMIIFMIIQRNKQLKLMIVRSHCVIVSS